MPIPHSLARLGALASLLAVGKGSGWAAEPLAAAERLEAAQIARHVRELGSDAFEGRGPGSAGAERAAAYLERELRALGVEPAGTDGYRQPVPLHATRPLPESELLVVSECDSGTLRLGEDYLLYGGGVSTLVPQATPSVFAGYGIVAPEFDYSDYEDLDVAGKVVVVLSGEPESTDPGYFDGPRPTVYSTPEAKQRTALGRGAYGTLIVPSSLEPSFKGWDYWRSQFAFESLTLAYTVPRHLAALVHPEAARRLFCGSGSSLEDVYAAEREHRVRGFVLPARVRFRGEFEERDFLGANVVGIVRGSDPELRDTYVLLSAHYDHLGIGPPVEGDAIYNGVVDNAIGTAGVLEIARVLAGLRTPPRRSVLLFFAAAEEFGLLGSSHYVEHPIVPLHRTAANLNVDGLAHLGGFRDVIGVGADLSSLGGTLRAAARSLGLVVSEPPDAFARSDAYAFSDQAAFAEAGVPALLVHEGFDRPGSSREAALAELIAWGRSRYHTPFDDLAQPLDFEAARRHLQVVLATLLAIAESDDDPRWKPGTPYALARLQSRAEGR